MKKSLFWIGVWVFLNAASFPVEAVESEQVALDIESIDIKEYGLYESQQVKRIKNADTATGFASVVTNLVRKKEVKTVEAKIGESFGFRFLVNGSPKGTRLDLDFVVHYPPPGIKNPTKKEATASSTTKGAATLGRMSFYGFQFTEEWEMVPGEWLFEIKRGEKKYAELAFEVVNKE